MHMILICCWDKLEQNDNMYNAKGSYPLFPIIQIVQ